MTKNETSGLLEAVKRSHYNAEIGVKMFLKRNPHLEPTPEMYALAIGVGRTPFPNIKGLPEGPFPVYKNRPYFDARLWHSSEQEAWEKEAAEFGGIC